MAISTAILPAPGVLQKMVHNGIEYGMMQAYAEGFQLLETSPHTAALGFGDLSHLWNRGSVVRSWLLELAEDAFRKEPELGDITKYVEDPGEGRWTVHQAVETGVPGCRSGPCAQPLRCLWAARTLHPRHLWRFR